MIDFVAQQHGLSEQEEARGRKAIEELRQHAQKKRDQQQPGCSKLDRDR